YKDGADLFLNPAIESALLPAFGKAYGAELLVRKNAGKLTGWVGYTYSRTLRQVQKNTGAETINKGKFYPSNVDKPHDLAVVANYKFTRRISMSANFTYNTGRPITYPDEVYVIDGYTFTQFSDRNQGRTPDYHRLDISFTLEGNLKQAQKYKGSWTLSIFNVYRRKNAYSIFFKPEYRGARPQAYRLSVLGSVFPSLTYNFKIN
ncbi:MAG: TonB-dependent receptor, partial [Bacteroidota bacterium]